MEKLKKSIIKFYNSLTSKGKLTLWSVLVIILALLYALVIRNGYKDNEINYNKVNIETLLSDSEVTYNRDIIMSLEGILNSIMKVSDGTLRINDNNISYRDLYNSVVSENYKKKISYSKFKKSMDKVLTDAYDGGSYDSNKTYITEVLYAHGYNMYLIKLGDNSYIGIIMNPSSYNIGYIE